MESTKNAANAIQRDAEQLSGENTMTKIINAATTDTFAHDYAGRVKDGVHVSGLRMASYGQDHAVRLDVAAFRAAKVEGAQHLRGNTRFGISAIPAGETYGLKGNSNYVEGPTFSFFGLATCIAANPEHGTYGDVKRGLAENREHTMGPNDVITLGDGNFWKVARINWDSYPVFVKVRKPRATKAVAA